jgi:hypothetical protein
MKTTRLFILAVVTALAFGLAGCATSKTVTVPVPPPVQY